MKQAEATTSKLSSPTEIQSPTGNFPVIPSKATDNQESAIALLNPEMSKTEALENNEYVHSIRVRRSSIQSGL